MMGASPVGAQVQGDKITFLQLPQQNRTHPDFVAPGREYKGFVFTPSFDLGLIYNDNVYAAQQNTQSDFITELRPALSINKKYGDNSMSIGLDATARQYADLTDENTLGFGAGTSGTLRFGALTTGVYRLNYRKSFLSREDPGAANATTEPVAQHDYSADIGLLKKFGRFNLALEGGAARKTYEDGTLRSTGAQRIFSDRNYNTYSAGVKLGYEFLGENIERPEHVIFVEGRYSENIYDERNANGTTSDNSQIGALAGLMTNYKGLVAGKLAAGYFMQDYEDSKDVSRFDIEADLALYITPRATLSFNASRDVLQDNSFISGYVETNLQAKIDYELLHSTFIGASQLVRERDFLGDDAGRTDDVLASSIYLRHDHSRYLQSRIELTHTTQDSTSAGAAYDQNIVMLRAIGKL